MVEVLGVDMVVVASESKRPIHGRRLESAAMNWRNRCSIVPEIQRKLDKESCVNDNVQPRNR